MNRETTETKPQINHYFMGKNTTVKMIIPDLIRHSLHIVLEGVSVRQVELKSVIQVHIVGDQVMSWGRG